LDAERMWAAARAGVVFTSGPDLVMPAFHLAVGVSYRLTTQRRVAAEGWRKALWHVLSTRVFGESPPHSRATRASCSRPPSPPPPLPPQA
jgi:hypothetical protein